MIKKLMSFLIIFPFLTVTSVFADWTKFGETDSAVHYIDFNETGSDDKYIYYWVLTNYLSPQKIELITDDYSSKKAYKQTDCKRFRTSAVQIILYKKEMSEGKILINESYKESSFTTPIFDSIGFEELEQICSHIQK